MAGLMVLTLLLALTTYSSATWCVCKEGLSDSALQKTIDYACGNGADCTATHSKGACFNPDTVKAHCCYAVNSYFQKKGQAQGSCDFSGTAIVTTTDPSSSGCVYPASASATTTLPGTTTPSTTTMTPPSTTTTTPGISTTTPVGNSPYLTTPPGVLVPAGGGINTDVSEGELVLLGRINVFSILIALVVSGLMF